MGVSFQRLISNTDFNACAAGLREVDVVEGQGHADRTGGGIDPNAAHDVTVRYAAAEKQGDEEADHFNGDTPYSARPRGC